MIGWVQTDNISALSVHWNSIMHLDLVNVRGLITQGLRSIKNISWQRFLLQAVPTYFTSLPAAQLLTFQYASIFEIVKIKLYLKSNGKHRSWRDLCSHNWQPLQWFLLLGNIIHRLFRDGLLARRRWHPIYINQIVKKIAHKTSCQWGIFKVLQRNSLRSLTKRECSPVFTCTTISTMQHK